MSVTRQPFRVQNLNTVSSPGSPCQVSPQQSRSPRVQPCATATFAPLPAEQVLADLAVEVDRILRTYAGGEDVSVTSADHRSTQRLQRLVDDLSGGDARAMAFSLLRSIRHATSAAQPTCAGPSQSNSGSQPSVAWDGVPAATPSPAAVAATSATPNTANLHAILMKASFSVGHSSAHNTEGSHTPSQRVASMSPSGAPTNGATLTNYHFRPKHRRESVDSFASQRISRSGTTTIRNTTSIERSVDKEGFKTINDYSVLKNLGRGVSGKVKLALHQESCELRAIKVIKRSLLKKMQNSNSIERFRKEVAIMKKLNHKNVIRLYEVIDDPESDKMYMVMQYMEKGELLRARPLGEHHGKESSSSDDDGGAFEPLSEAKVIKYIRQIMSGLVYLHNHGIVHFDVKPQNILRGEDDHVVIADFGVSELMLHEDENTAPCCGYGSPAYMAPEVCRGDAVVNGEAVDTWSLGITTYALLYGKVPFYAPTVRVLFEHIQQKNIEYPPHATPLQIDFLSHMLERDALKRWTLRKLREHPFLNPDGLQHSGIAPLGDTESKPNPLTVTQAEVDHALSSLVTPVSGFGEAIVSVSRSPSVGSSDAQYYSRNSSPQQVSTPVPAPPTADLDPALVVPNPRQMFAAAVWQGQHIDDAPSFGEHPYARKDSGSILENAW